VTTRKRASGAGSKRARRWSIALDVVGLGFRTKASGRRALHDMIVKRGEISGMRLVREPDNKADSNAIMVCMPERLMEGMHIGYLRSSAAELLAPRLDKGVIKVVSAKLESLDANDDYKSGVLALVFKDVSYN